MLHFYFRNTQNAKNSYETNSHKNRPRLRRGLFYMKMNFFRSVRLAGPLAAEIYRYACGLRQMLLDTLRNRLDLIEHYWEANWERLLNERASGQGAYRKSTVLMDHLTKMFSFYRTELPEQVEQALEQRFQPIFEKMLDWRPHRSGGLYAFGLDMKMVCYYSDEKKQIFRNLLDAMQQEGGLRLKNNCDPGTNADEYIIALEDFFCPTEESDYSWGFKSEQTRDRIFTQLQSFFERPDLRQFLLLEDEETPSALVKFQAYPCECSDGCYHYSREIDEEWYQKYTNFSLLHLLNPFLNKGLL